MTVKKIEELLESAEKKVHAGEWLRIEQVRILLNQYGIWLIEQHQQDLRELKHEILFRGREILEEGEEE